MISNQPSLMITGMTINYWVEGTAEVTTALTFRTTAKVGKVLSQDAEITDVEL